MAWVPEVGQDSRLSMGRLNIAGMLWVHKMHLVQNAGVQVEHRNPQMQEASHSQEELESATAG